MQSTKISWAQHKPYQISFQDQRYKTKVSSRAKMLRTRMSLPQVKVQKRKLIGKKEHGTLHRMMTDIFNGLNRFKME